VIRSIAALEPCFRPGRALLARAVGHAPLDGAHRALRDAIRRPGAEGRARAPSTAVQLRQRLEADALAGLAVAGRAGEVVRAGAQVEQLRAIGEGLQFQRMGNCGTATGIPRDCAAM
jgi:hypothetical protein